MKFLICGFFENRLNGSDIEICEFILKLKLMGKKLKVKILILNFIIL